MEIEPVGSIDAVGGAYTLPVSSVDPSIEAPTLHSLAESKEQETTAQRAQDGDPVAISQLATEAALVIPVQSQNLDPLHSGTLTGPHEPGKGILIDVYD